MSKAMGISSDTLLHRCFTLLWLLKFSLFFYFPTVFCSSSTVSYTDHCSSIVPEERLAIPVSPISSFPQYIDGYYPEGSRYFGRDQNSTFVRNLSFRTRNVYQTVDEDVLQVGGTLTIRNPNTFYFSFNQSDEYGGFDSPQNFRGYNRVRVISFGLRGLWSESTGMLCMVGRGTSYSEQGDLLHLKGVLKLKYVKNSTLVTSLVSGILESLSSIDDSSHFDPILILGFTQKNYEFTLDMKEFGSSDGSEVPKSLPVGFSLCSLLQSNNGFELKYPSKCNDSAENCLPFGGSTSDLPQFMALKIQCSNDFQRPRLLLKFLKNNYDDYYQRFDPKTTLVGEGLWDEKKNQLFVVACKFLNVTGSLADAHLGDCSTRLSLRFPAIWSIRDTRSIEGQIWSSKAASDSDYFEKIMFYTENTANRIGGLKYEYTQIERVKKLCPEEKPKKKRYLYPDEYSNDMSFGFSFGTHYGNFSWGDSNLLFVGDNFIDHSAYAMAPLSSTPVYSFVVPKFGNASSVNVSYKISIGLQLGGGNEMSNFSLNSYMQAEMSAEGIYDTRTGHVCMIGCSKIGLNGKVLKNDSKDCEILVKFQFPARNSSNDAGYIKGSIESLRKHSDPLFFRPLNLSSNAFVSSVALETTWRMDFETTLVLISNTLACVFVILQLFYVKKHPQMLPFTSLLMLGILTLGYMIPLVLNFEALFLRNSDRQTVMFESGKWLEVNEVLVRVITMVAFLLQFRLLQLTWSSRTGDDGNHQKDLWASEKKAFLYVLFPLYLAGAFIAWLGNWQKNNIDNSFELQTLSYPSSPSYQENSLWVDLKSYAGLVLDGFLVPQILLNMFGNTREKVLSYSFYIGTTLIRLLPHAYDLYRTHYNDAGRFEGSYIFANHGVDFYSTAWDVIIPCLALLLAAIVFLQQRFGARCVLPRSLREVELYEKVPVDSSAQ